MCTNRPGFQVLCAEQRCVQDALENHDVQQLECDSVWVISRVHVGYLLLQLLHTLCLAIYRYHLRRKYKPCLRSIHIKAQMAILFPGRVVHIECRLLCSTGRSPCLLGARPFSAVTRWPGDDCRRASIRKSRAGSKRHTGARSSSTFSLRCTVLACPGVKGSYACLP